MTGIPSHHVVDAWAVTRLDPNEAAKVNFIEDGIHPNEKGSGKIAQEFFMKMSLSPEWLAK